MKQVDNKPQWYLSSEMWFRHHLESCPVILFVEGIFDFDIIREIYHLAAQQFYEETESQSLWKHTENDLFFQNTSLQQDDSAPWLMAKSKIPSNQTITG